MYNIKQISIYCLLSFLLSLIITTFYIKKLNKEYYFVFILLFIAFYLFFYLMNMENKEDFSNFSYYAEGYDKLYVSSGESSSNSYSGKKHSNTQHFLQEEEEHHITKHHKKHHMTQEEEHHHMPQEEEHHYKKTEPTQEEEMIEQPVKITKNKVDLEGLSIKNSVKGNTCSPVNINIYNGEVETPDNNKKDNSCKKSKNLGDYKSRVYNNSDWIYGTSSWTNSPDFYIPTPNDLLPTYNNSVQNISQKQNEVLLKKKFSDSKMVCPIMINTPWSEYKSGDKEPEGFNL